MGISNRKIIIFEIKVNGDSYDITLCWGVWFDMRILYVTPLWSGFRDILLDGAVNAKGMPAFINPLKRLVEQGHQVDIIIAAADVSEKDLNISVDWLDRTRIVFVDWNIKGYKKVLSILELYSTINHILRENKYDFVYGHGSIGAIANMVANHHGINCGIRLYGTFLASEINRISRLQIAIRHPLEYMAFKLSKNFFLITNDGTKGDQVYNYLTNNRAKYKFCFMLNGVDLPEPMLKNETDLTQFQFPFIIYPARITRWKRQHLAIDILKGLHNNGVPMNLYFAGHITDMDYWSEIEEEIANYGLTSFVSYLGTVDNTVLYSLYQNAVAVLSLYEISNLGNVLIEALSYGAVVLSLNDGSLDTIVENGKNAILVNEPDEAVNQILFLYKNDSKALEIRKSATNKAMEIFKDWESRVGEEIQLIENAVIKEKNKY